MWGNFRLPGMGGSMNGGFEGLGGTPVGGSMASNPTFDVMSGGGMDVKATGQKHSNFATRFARNPGSGPGGPGQFDYGFSGMENAGF